jgi:hypothetical protein
MVTESEGNAESERWGRVQWCGSSISCTPAVSGGVVQVQEQVQTGIGTDSRNTWRANKKGTEKSAGDDGAHARERG